MTPEALYPILSKYAAGLGIELNADKGFVLDILSGFLRNEGRYGYRSCPCRLASGDKGRDADIICPCAYRDEDVRQYGSCYCGLYVSKDWNKGSMAKTVVPERRNLRRLEDDRK